MTGIISEILANADIELALLGGQMRTLDGPWRRLRRLMSEAADTLSEDDGDVRRYPASSGSAPIVPSRTIGFHRQVLH